jgi:tRNA threonylcarbamoyladenosine biosynthesis protein TsaE
MRIDYSIEEIRPIALKCIEVMNGRKVVAFHGPMGSGKTTLIHAICDEKKVSSPVSSPTFALINEYNSPSGSIFHIDLYRLNDEEEAVRAGVEDCLYSGKTCFVEWPEKAPSIFPEGTIHFFIEFLDEKKRRLIIQS